MKKNARLIESEIYKWFDVFKGNASSPLVEIRCIGKGTLSGYFTEPSLIAQQLDEYATDYNVYFIINDIDSACYERTQKNKLLYCDKKIATTNDDNIVGRSWFLIDIDPVRPADTCATDEEVGYAHKKAQDVYRFLIEQGFNEPLVVFSSSGYHLYLKCSLTTSKENDDMLKKFLLAIGMLFNDEHVKIDPVVYNRARISRLPGSYSCKGSKDSTQRPQRNCHFLSIPEEIKNNDIEYFQKVANLYPEVERPSRENNYNHDIDKFNLDEFIQKHGINVTKIENTTDGTKYILDHCIFDENHKGKDAMIFRRNDGAIAYHCFHSSCSNYTWKDVRLKFEPDAYSKKDYAEYRYKRAFNGYDTPRFHIQEENPTLGEKWLSMDSIKYIDVSNLPHIPTGIKEFDKKSMGLFLGDVSILSGISASGKSSLINLLIANTCQQGYNVGVFSGELQDFRFKGWLNQLIAGKSNVKKVDGHDDLYYCPNKISEKIDAWTKNHVFLFNNNYGHNWAQVFNDIKELVEKRKCQMIILDNLMTLDISDYEGVKNEQQTRFVNDVKEYAKLNNVHILVVCHPRKDNGFLRMESISGTADIYNICDNCFIIHRVGLDFAKRSAEFFGEEKANEMMQYNSVIEVAKNRMFGVKDFLIGMYFEMESRRLKNEISENKVYGWFEEPTEELLYEPIVTSAITPNENFWNTDEQINDDDLPF